MIEFDPHYDQEGVILQREVMCGKCMKDMKQVDPHLFKCPHCGQTYKDESSEDLA